MTHLVVSTVLDAAPAAVWDDISDISTHVEWMADAERIEFDGTRTRGIGTRFRCRTRVGPIRLDDVMEVTRWDPPTAMGITHQGLVGGEGVFRLSPIDEGRRTLFVWDEHLRFPWWMGGVIGGIVARPVLAAIWRRNLRHLAARL